jgi:hypothetical protein
MPYISPKDVKIKREALKKEFPNVKFSVTCKNYSSINVHIMESPFDIEGNTRINPYFIEKNFEKTSDIRDFLLKVKRIINAENGTEVIDGDYGVVPNFYIHIEFGKWDKPHIKK